MIQIFHIDDMTTQDGPNPRVENKVAGLEKLRIPKSGTANIANGHFTGWVPGQGPGPKDTDYQLELITQEIMTRNRGERVLIWVGDCCGLIRNRAVATCFTALLIATGKFDMVVAQPVRRLRAFVAGPPCVRSPEA